MFCSCPAQLTWILSGTLSEQGLRFGRHIPAPGEYFSFYGLPEASAHHLQRLSPVFWNGFLISDFYLLIAPYLTGH